MNYKLITSLCRVNSITGEYSVMAQREDGEFFQASILLESNLLTPDDVTNVLKTLDDVINGRI